MNVYSDKFIIWISVLLNESKEKSAWTDCIGELNSLYKWINSVGGRSAHGGASVSVYVVSWRRNKYFSVKTCYLIMLDRTVLLDCRFLGR